MNNPIGYVDPFGLYVTVIYYPYSANTFGHIGVGVNTKSTVGFYPANEDLFTRLQVADGYDVPGMIKPDTGVPGKTFTLLTTPEQDMARSGRTE